MWETTLSTGGNNTIDQRKNDKWQIIRLRFSELLAIIRLRLIRAEPASERR